MAAWQGMTDILRYNARFYALSILAALLALVAALQALSLSLRIGLVAFAFGTLFFLAASLGISHYVYDRSPLRSWSWLSLPRPPQCWAVIHAGLDEASPDLRRLYPGAEGVVLDIYDPVEMTEPAIARARAMRPPPEPARAARPEALPLAEASLDLVVLFFAAHEVRRAALRERFFGELMRVLHPTGTLLLVEHLRDAPNFLAFGPGAFHFLARAEWLRVAGHASLRLRQETRITPFVRAFSFERAT